MSGGIEKSLRDGKYLHVDVSLSLYKTGKSGVACVSSDKSFEVGTTLSSELKKELFRKLNANKHTARFYAIIIYKLLSTVDLSKYEGLVICNDAQVNEVISFLDCLFESNPNYLRLEKCSISQLRTRSQNPSLSSLADYRANAYRIRGLKKLRRNKGRPLNYCEIKLEAIESCWQNLPGLEIKK